MNKNTSLQIATRDYAGATGVKLGECALECLAPSPKGATIVMSATYEIGGGYTAIFLYNIELNSWYLNS